MSKVIFWGAGTYGRDFLKECKKASNIYNDEIIAFVDSNVDKWGTYIEGIKIISPVQVMKENFNYIVITSIYINQIKEQLINLGINTKNIITSDGYSHICYTKYQYYQRYGYVCNESKMAMISPIVVYTCITGNYDNIATMPCNPSIGGSAKGIIVREIDALGGEMGINADKTLLQMKMLNSSKGPAVRSLRAQADKVTYPKEMRKTLENTKNLDIKISLVEDLIVENNTVKGVILEDKTKIESEIVILTTGTYLKSDILIGNTRTRSGPHGEKPSMHLSDKLKEYGFEILRLKTGTPPRIKRDTIDFTKTKVELGDTTPYTFSHDIEPYMM